MNFIVKFLNRNGFPNIEEDKIRNMKYLLTREGSQITGVLVYDKDDEFLDIEYIAVHKDYRGRGIAKRLIKEIEEIAKKEGINKIFVTCVNDASKNLFVGFGYRPITKFNYKFLETVRCVKEI